MHYIIIVSLIYNTPVSYQCINQNSFLYCFEYLYSSDLQAKTQECENLAQTVSQLGNDIKELEKDVSIFLPIVQTYEDLRL